MSDETQDKPTEQAHEQEKQAHEKPVRPPLSEEEFQRLAADTKARGRCGRRKRTDGYPCEGRPEKGRDCCKFHGGRNKVGAASPSFRHGKYSKFLNPVALRDAYESAIADPNLMSLREEVAIWQARVNQLVGRIGSGDGTRYFRALGNAWAGFEAAQRGKDKEAMGRALDQLRKLIQRGASEEQQWDDLRDAIRQKAELSQAEMSMLRAAHAMVTVEEALSAILQVVDVMNKHIVDPAILSEATKEVVEIIGMRRPIKQLGPTEGSRENETEM